MCKRTTSDPLIRKFLDDYKLNLLPLPRSGIGCGDVFRRDSARRVSTEFSLSSVITPSMPDLALDRDESLGALSGTLSHSRELDFALDLLGGFLAALGAPGILSKAGAHYRRSRVSSLAFEFRDATRDSIDPGALADALIDRRLRADSPLVLAGSSYFVVSGLARSRSVTVHANAQSSSGTGVEVEAMEIAGAQAGVTVDRESDSTVTYTGSQSLVFGVELYELDYDEVARAFRMLTPEGPLFSHGAVPPVLEPAFVGAAGDAFIDLQAAA